MLSSTSKTLTVKFLRIVQLICFAFSKVHKTCITYLDFSSLSKTFLDSIKRFIPLAATLNFSFSLSTLYATLYEGHNSTRNGDATEAIKPGLEFSSIWYSPSFQKHKSSAKRSQSNVFKGRISKDIDVCVCLLELS